MKLQLRSRCFHPIEQGTDEWLNLRKTVDYTSTAIPEAIGIGYNSRNHFTRCKLSDEAPPKSKKLEEILKYGSTNEKNAFMFFQKTMVDLDDGRTEISDKAGFFKAGVLVQGCKQPCYLNIGASPDGLISDMFRRDVFAVIEIKCPWTKRLYTLGPNNAIPVNHYIQMLIQMLLVNVDYGYYVVWTPTEKMILKVYFSEPALLVVFRELVHYHKNILEPLVNANQSFVDNFLGTLRMPPGYKSKMKHLLDGYQNNELIYRVTVDDLNK